MKIIILLLSFSFTAYSSETFEYANLFRNEIREVMMKEMALIEDKIDTELKFIKVYEGQMRYESCVTSEVEKYIRSCNDIESCILKKISEIGNEVVKYKNICLDTLKVSSVDFKSGRYAFLIGCINSSKKELKSHKYNDMVRMYNYCECIRIDDMTESKMKSMNAEEYVFLYGPRIEMCSGSKLTVEQRQKMKDFFNKMRSDIKKGE